MELARENEKLKAELAQARFKNIVLQCMLTLKEEPAVLDYWRLDGFMLDEFEEIVQAAQMQDETCFMGTRTYSEMIADMREGKSLNHSMTGPSTFEEVMTAIKSFLSPKVLIIKA